ncbi:hypothetical protein HDV03_001518 [Kappamyces sp. JEL0829]|nr:hypothetical protein HDV03_001518 [Kappamyces sp. JEL0829]
MDKADSEFLQHLFRENNALRGTITSLKRQLHNATSALDESELELKNTKLKMEETVKDKPATAQPTHAPVHTKTTEDKPPPSPSVLHAGQDSGELKFIVERQEAEIFQMGEELYKLRNESAQEREKAITLERDVSLITAEVADLRAFKEKAIEEKEEMLRKQAEMEPDMDQQELKRLLALSQAQCAEYKAQLLDFANEANQIQNSQQNQLQGVEAMMEGIRDEYEEFISITRLENESFQERQKGEYNALKQEFDDHKSKTFEEKKRTMMEYQNILSSMQSQFDEYRITTEMLFNMEMVKLEEEITSQASRYEQEIMYVIQAKDKFYLDMMVTKDAKIMGLIEGSDLQSIMQKHELDMENMRKEHAKDVERVKTEHESESKNVMLLLQRQNVSLESKTEKLQSHLKTIEARMKELMATIDAKNKTITERDDMRMKLEADYQACAAH